MESRAARLDAAGCDFLHNHRVENPGSPFSDQATELLVQVLYADLHRVAHRERRRKCGAVEALGTTALVHEAYLKLAQRDVFKSRAHFLNTAALAMRQVLATNARAQLRTKRGSGDANFDIESVDVLVESDERIIALDEALTTLEHSAPRLARVVECRYFAGYTDAETALALGVTERTVERDWAMAKALLYEALGSR